MFGIKLWPKIFREKKRPSALNADNYYTPEQTKNEQNFHEISVPFQLHVQIFSSPNRQPLQQDLSLQVS